MNSINNNQLYSGSSAVAYCSEINSSSYARAVSTLNGDGSAIAMNNSSVLPSSTYTLAEQRDDTTLDTKQTANIDMISRDQPPPPPQVAGIVATVSNEEVNEFMQYLSHKNNIDNCNTTADNKAVAVVKKNPLKKKSGPKKKKSVSKKAHTCKHEGCTNNVVNSGVCYRHGAKKRLCKHEGCTNMIKR